MTQLSKNQIKEIRSALTSKSYKKERRAEAKEIGIKLYDKLDRIDRSVMWFWRNHIEPFDDTDVSLFGFYNIIKGATGTYDDRIIEIIRNFVDGD